MNSILKKIRQSDAFNKENRVSRIKAVILMSLFTFTFLEAEFLFVDMISCTVSGDKSVNAQNYALGASVVGSALYPSVFKALQKGSAICNFYWGCSAVGRLSFSDMPSQYLRIYIVYGACAVFDSRSVRRCGVL